MTTKSEISRNSYRETTITLTTVSGKCREVEKLLCTLPGTPQRPLGLFAMKNTINKNFPIAQNFVFIKFLFFDYFWSNFSSDPHSILSPKHGLEWVFDRG